MRPALLFLVLATPMAAAADVVHLSNGQVVTGVVRSCQGGDVVIEPPASAPVLLKIADVASGEGADIERCLGGSSRDPEVTRGRWYCWQIIVTEAASVVAVPVAAGIDSPGLAIVGLSGAILSPAIVHMAHGNPGRGAASVGIHLGMGLAGLLLGAVIVPDNHNDDVMNLAGPALGLFVSQVVATTIDVASFAYEEPPSRFAVGALLAPAGRDPRTVRKQVSGLQLSLRF
ncbi:MAG: hypothetical protein ACJ78Z_12515 [Myxococcales bacterium]